jgi:hypothetical protein
MNRQQTIEKYYEMGKNHSEMYTSVRQAVEYGEAELMWIGTEELIAYEAGLLGCEMPHKVTGWRYGHIPANGHSYNYRDDRAEAGVSLMETDCGLKTADPLMNVMAGSRPRVRVEGWLNTIKRGSDGEPLVFWAKEIE